MGIGRIGSYVQPYIYRNNEVSSASLGKVDAIPQDATTSKVDYSSLVGETVNPLKAGQSMNFADIMHSQMSMGVQNAARLMDGNQEAIRGMVDVIANLTDIFGE